LITFSVWAFVERIRHIAWRLQTWCH